MGGTVVGVAWVVVITRGMAPTRKSLYLSRKARAICPAATTGKAELEEHPLKEKSSLGTPLLLTAVLWLCSLPLVLILGLPLLGSGQAWTVAAMLLVIYLAVCLYLCRRREEEGAAAGEGHPHDPSADPGSIS